MVAIDSVKNYISGIKLLHILLNFSCEGFSGFEVKLAIRGLARLNLRIILFYVLRLNPHRCRQPLPITPSVLVKMHQELDFSLDENVVWWTVFLLSFYLMARKSNMVPNSIHTLDPHKQLLAEDIIVGSKCLVVHLKWSKTNQYGK